MKGFKELLGWWTHGTVARWGEDTELLPLPHTLLYAPLPHTLLYAPLPHTLLYAPLPHTLLYAPLPCACSWVASLNKWVIVSKVLFRVLWTVLANYQTQRGHCGNPWFIARRKSEILEAWTFDCHPKWGPICETEPLTCGVCTNSKWLGL